MGSNGDLISRSALIEVGTARKIIEVVGNWDELPGIAKSACTRLGLAHRKLILEAPAVDAVEVTGQDVQFLIDALYYHVRRMKAGGLDKPECGYDERIALLDRLMLFEREHFPDMEAETEG